MKPETDTAAIAAFFAKGGKVIVLPAGTAYGAFDATKIKHR